MTLSTTDIIETSPEAVGLSSRGLHRLSTRVQGYVDEKRIAGAITMVARHGQVAHFQTYGSMDEEAGKPMAADAIFRIYSMTKPIASVALMTLYEEGLFQLDDAVSKYVPEFKDLRVFAGGTADNYETRAPSREMTVRDVLCHTSGLAAGFTQTHTVVGEIYRKVGVPGIPSTGTLHDTIQALARAPLAVDPGSEWIYSMSTDVVAYLCEVLSGQSFDRFLAERILQPLGMVDTAFYVPASKLDRFAANYRPLPGGSLGHELFDAPATSQFASNGTYFSGVGGLTSTAFDYMRFAKMLANGGELDGARILGPRTVAYMATNHLPGGKDIYSMVPTHLGPASRQPGTGFGLGFAVLLNPAEAQIMGSVGEYYWSGAASTEFFISPADDLIVLFMPQLMGSLYPFRRDIRVAAYSALLD
jgi:CubicO group peptidase (beta-lactamase class C family)